ncbi:type III secretion system chaperone [Ramlibacter rhizophilus]|uniref:Type III secretion system chaperone n=1 Tax=Ramlibacter rhizophilus TaxID=1781167 RepID=A0A4Z0BSY4_9BURK|nr:type III secretion system chaperone [Ramlibacter rhizophilus]TFZ01145.1 hypothetical protein EZ242_07070 [Ramlibacter rhizophilus]
MEFTELIDQLSQQLNLQGLQPGPGGRCAVRFDDVVVQFAAVPSANAVDLSAQVGVVDLREPQVMQLLQSTRDNSIALHWNERGEVTVRQRFWLQVLSFPHFFRSLNLFITQAEHWRVRLKATYPV